MRDALTTKQYEQLAKGPNPLDRVVPPLPGERCPRCHGGAPKFEGCALCNPNGPSRLKAVAEGRIL